jgi:hypothetical protein
MALELRKKPEVSLNEDTILIKTDGLALIIETNTGFLYINGIRLKTTQTDRKYITDFKKEENLDKSHKRLKSIKLPHELMFIINKGYDARIFFHLYTAKEYAKFRGNPYWSASWWNTQKAWYEQDMIIPRREWK